MKLNAFPKYQRLKSRKTLKQLFANGKSVRADFIRLIYIIEKNQPGELKCGVGVSSKYFKKAVDRNRIKRLLREAYRLQQHPIKTAAAEGNFQLSIFFLYTGKLLPNYADVYNNVEVALQKLFVNINAANIKNT